MCLVWVCMGFVDGDSIVGVEYSFEVVNVVGSGVLGERVDVVSVGEDLDGFGFRGVMESGGGVFDFDGGSDGLGVVTLYESGSFIVRGSSECFVDVVCEEFVESVGGLVGDSVGGGDCSVCNVVGVGCVGVERIDLGSLAVGLGLECTEYEPEQFSALTFRGDGFESTFLVFSTGKVVVVGGSSEVVARGEFERFVGLLSEWVGGVVVV